MKTSLHGGHSGQFCDHARDLLAEIVDAYVIAGFSCAGLCEHMPPMTDAWLYPDERELGRSALWMQERFARYVGEARRLQGEYATRLRLVLGMETEWYPGAEVWVQTLRELHGLEYVVGSLHHVQGICFDYSREEYSRAVNQCGSLAEMYVTYFDEQERMLREIRPEVVGHFDLIRLHDPDYWQTLGVPHVWERVLRNLALVKEMGCVLDINARALLKGQPEPYVSASVLYEAVRLGIPLAYGDDAHGVRDVGCRYGEVADIVRAAGGRLWDFTSFADCRAARDVARPAT